MATPSPTPDKPQVKQTFLSDLPSQFQTIAGLTALAIWREARGEVHQAKIGVLNVIRNRMFDPQHRWPHTAIGVILQPLQFSSFNPSDPNSTKFPVDRDPTWIDCMGIVEANPPLPDPTSGANHYHSYPIDHPRLAKLAPWADINKLTARIGAFSFYKL